MSESAAAATSVTGVQSTGVSIGNVDGKSAGVSIGAGVEKSAGVTVGMGGGKDAGVTIGIGREKSAGVTLGHAAGDRSTGVSVGVGAEKSAGVTRGHVPGDRSAGVSVRVGVEKSAGMSRGIGGERSVGIDTGKSAGNPRGISGTNSAAPAIGIGSEKSAGVSTGHGSEKSTGASIRAGGEKLSVGVSIPESVVAPLIGAGANVYIMTNELTQSMREKLGTSWPFVQETLNSRFAKLLAGGLLASVAFIVVWKIIKRFSAKPKTPADSDDDPCQWTTTKTYELTPVSEVKPQALRPEGDHAGTYPMHMLPHKIQLRIAETPLQGAKAGQPELCKARDPATRHRHTHHLGQHQGEQATAESYSPWHSEPPHESDLECSCPTDLCVSVEPQPRLLYSVRQSHMVRRDMNVSNPTLENLLNYTSCPSILYPSVMESNCPHRVYPKSCGLSLHPTPACSAHMSLAPGRTLEGAAPLSHQHLFHSPFTDVNLLTTPSQLASSCLSLHCGSVQNPLPTGASTGISVPGAMSLCSVPETQPMCSVSGTTVYQTLERQSRSQTVESRARSVSQQTDGHPVEEDLDMPAHAAHPQQRGSHQTGPTVQTQNIPTRRAQSPVTPSQCTNTPTRTDNTPMHVHTSVTCPTHLSSNPQSCLPTVYQTPQGAVVQLSAGGECMGSYPGLHQHALHFHTQPLSGFGNTALSAPSQLPLPPLTYHQHVSIDPILPSALQQQQAIRVQTPYGQQQQPVVQHPSDSSVSQNSSEVCASQEARQNEGGQLTTGTQETTPPGVLSQERALLPQQLFNTSGAITPVSPPHSAINHHHHSSLRAVTDFTHTTYPWQGPQGLHSYQPTPLCAVGFQSPSSKPYSPWPAPTAMFVPSSFVSPSGGLFVSSPAGILASPSGLLPSPHQGPLMASHWQSPYLYSQAPLPVARHTTFNPNFNLSNSNAHIFMQESDQNTVQVVPFPQEPSRIRVIASDHSINSNQGTATLFKAQSAAISSSEISIQTVGGDPADILKKEVQQIPGTSGHSLDNSQSCGTSPAAFAAMEEKSQVFPVDAEGPQVTETVQGDGVATEHGEELPADSQVRDHGEEASTSNCSTAGVAINDGMETQL